jgi:hypothetical protein
MHKVNDAIGAINKFPETQRLNFIPRTHIEYPILHFDLNQISVIWICATINVGPTVRSEDDVREHITFLFCHITISE